MDINQYRRKLLSRHAELVHLQSISQEGRSAVKLDQQSVGRLSRMDAMQQQAMAAATQRQRDNEISRIINALRRMDEDEYGLCVQCGGDIAKQRLEIDPAATHCISCAR